MIELCCEYLSVTSNPNISKTVSHSIINYTIFGKTVTRHFRCMYVNCFDRLRFFAEVSTKLQKMHFFRQFKDHNSGGKYGNWTNDPIIFIYFFHCNVCNINL